MKEQVYLDSNVFICASIYDPASSRQATSAAGILRRVATGKVNACTGVITWDEVVWVAWRLFGQTVAKAQGRALLGIPRLVFLPADERALQAAQELIEEYDLKPRDALHLATAISNGTKTVVSEDRELDAVNRIHRIGIEEFDKEARH